MLPVIDNDAGGEPLALILMGTSTILRTVKSTEFYYIMEHINSSSQVNDINSDTQGYEIGAARASTLPLGELLRLRMTQDADGVENQWSSASLKFLSRRSPLVA
jgi:hypothetical protein